MNIDRYLDASHQVLVKDLDFDAASRVGLTDDERFTLEYFADIEGETLVYFRSLLDGGLGDDPDAAAFLTMWNYEEFFHGRALARMLAVCGHPLEGARATRMIPETRTMRAMQLSFRWVFERALFRRQFPALYMAWGASQELVTLRGYEALAARTANPVLRELAKRIARQERRHFAWYFNAGSERLAASKSSQRFAREVMARTWAPVGAGEKGWPASLRLLSILFPGEAGEKVVREIDARISTLPGLEGLRLLAGFVERARARGTEEPSASRPLGGRRAAPGRAA